MANQVKLKPRASTNGKIIGIIIITIGTHSNGQPNKKIITNEDFFKAGLIRNKNVLVKILGNGKINHSLNLKVDKASQSAIKLISDKKGKIDYNEKTKKTEKKVSKEEKAKKN